MQFRSKNLSVVLACGPHKFLQIISAFLFCFREYAQSTASYKFANKIMWKHRYTPKSLRTHWSLSRCCNWYVYWFWEIWHEHQYFLPSRHRPSIHSKWWLQVQIPFFSISTKWQVFAFSVPLHCSFILHVSFISLFAEKLKEFMNFSTFYTLRIRCMLLISYVSFLKVSYPFCILEIPYLLRILYHTNTTFDEAPLYKHFFQMPHCIDHLFHILRIIPYWLIERSFN